jgi:hypothetical protein
MRKIFKPKTINDYYLYAKQLLAEGKRDEARDVLDFGIIKIADAKMMGKTDNDLLDGVRIGLLLERYWYTLENNDLLLGGDEEVINGFPFLNK